MLDEQEGQNAVHKLLAAGRGGAAGGSPVARGGGVEPGPGPVGLGYVRENGWQSVSRSQVLDSGRARFGIGGESASGIDWLVEKFIPFGGLGFIWGARSVYKTFIALDLANRIARGMPWAGRETKRSPVLYFAAEDAAGVRLRNEAWCKYYGEPDTGLLEIASRPVNLLDNRDVAEVAEFVRAAQHKLVIFDTLKRHMPGGTENAQTADPGLVVQASEIINDAFYRSDDDLPNSSEVTAQWLRTTLNYDEPVPSWVLPHEAEEGMAERYARVLRVVGRPTVLLVHHGTGDRMRGPTEWENAADMLLRVKHDGRTKSSTATAEKVKNGELDWKVVFKFEGVDVYEEGDSGLVIPSRRGSNSAQANHVKHHVKPGKPKADCPFCVAEGSL